MAAVQQRVKSIQENDLTTPDALRRKLEDMKVLKRVFEEDPAAFAEHPDVLKRFEDDFARLQATVDSHNGA